MHHLVTLRQAIVDRGSVRISYASQGTTETLRYDRAGFYGEKEIVIRQLREIYCSDDVQIAKFMAGDNGALQHVPAVAAIIHSLNDFQVGEEMQQRIMHLLHRLPPAIVKLVPLNRAGFKDFTSYQQLHQQALQDGTCDMAAYVSEAGEEAEQQRRLRVFLACFFLGLIATQKDNKPDGSGRPKNNASALQRIIQRIKGL